MSTIFAVASVAISPGLCANHVNRQYSVVVLPPDGGPDSFLAGYLFYAPLDDRGALGVAADTSTPGALPFNSYTWTNGRQVDLQPLPQLPNLTGTNTYINWINQPGFVAGYGTRTDSVAGVSLDHAAIWTPDGQIVELSTPGGDQSRGVWINDSGQVSGWIENSTPNPCAFGVGLQFQSQAVMWQSGNMIPLGTLGGANSYGEFINNRGQVGGHSETSNVPDPILGCPPIDPFVWENGKMTDINPGNFGGGLGGMNFLNNRGQAVGFGLVTGDVAVHAFLWSEGNLTDLSGVGNLGGAASSGFNVNELGHVVGVSTNADGATIAVLWRGEEFINLSTLSGDDCSEPAFINSQDQIVGTSLSCETGVSHAFLWENNELVDLNTLIPADSGLELDSANWINDDGAIAAQALLTQGINAGASRAVLLIPTESDSNAQAESTTRGNRTITSRFTATSPGPKKKLISAFTEDGRVNPLVLRPFDPTKLRGKAPQ